MNDLANFTSEATMTSLEISELSGVRHDNVKRTIKIFVNQQVISQPQFEDGIKSKNGIVPKYYIFTGEQGRLDSITVMAQIMPKLCATIVKRWDELEKQVRQPQQQLQTSESVFMSWMNVAARLRVPEHIAQIESMKAAKPYGEDYSPLLKSSPAQDNIEPDNKWLEVSDLAALLGGFHKGRSGGAQLNRMLEDMGLQYKHNGSWTPSHQAKGMFTNHSWKDGEKGGYNLKWNVNEIRKLLNK